MTSSALEFDDLDEDSVKHLLSFFGPRELLTLQTVRRARRRAGRGRPTGHTARAARTLACSHLHIKHLHRNTKHASARLQRGGHACHRGWQVCKRLRELANEDALWLRLCMQLPCCHHRPRCHEWVDRTVCAAGLSGYRAAFRCVPSVASQPRSPASRARADRRRRIF